MGDPSSPAAPDEGLASPPVRDRNVELDGVRVLSPEAVEELLRPQTGAAAMRGVVGLRRAGSRYALGNWVTDNDPDGRGVWNSSPGAFGCIPWLDRSNDVYGILLMRTAGGPGGVPARCRT